MENDQLRSRLLAEARRICNDDPKLVAATIAESLTDAILLPGNGLESDAHRLDIASTIMAWLAGQLTVLRKKAIAEVEASPQPVTVPTDQAFMSTQKVAKIMQDLITRVLEKWRVRSSEEIVRLFCACITGWIQSPDCKIVSPRETLDRVIVQMVELQERLDRQVS